ERNPAAVEEVGHRLDQPAREEHARLGRVHADVVEDRLELCDDELARQLVHGRDRGRVLRRQRDESAHPVAAGGREGLQVGLDAGTPARIGRGDGETTRYWHFTPFAGTNRIRFDGCDLSPEIGAPRERHSSFNSEMATAAALWDDLLQGEELAHLDTVPAADPRLAPLPPELDPRVRDALAARGLDSLYAHQALAWEAAARGENVIVTTGTASGKTLAFNLPVLDALAREPKTRALYLYPTKALAQDQARSVTALRVPGVRPAIYDGDTETERRWQIRRSANLV